MDEHTTCVWLSTNFHGVIHSKTVEFVASIAFSTSCLISPLLPIEATLQQKYF